MKQASNEKPTAPTDVPQATSGLECRSSAFSSLNRRFGCERLIQRFLWSWFQPETSYRVLDLGAATGETPRFIADWCEARSIAVRIDVVCGDQASLEAARAACPGCANIQWIRGNPLSFETSLTYDLVYCSLAPRRFNEEEAVILLRQCRDLSHQFVVIADLERSLATTLAVWLLTLICREPGAREYGRRCARKAFSWKELRNLAKAAEWGNFRQARFLLCSQAIWLFKRDLGEVRPFAVGVPEVMPCPS